MRRHLVLVIPAAICILAAANWCSAQQLTLTPYKASGIYGIGDKVGWTVASPSGTTPASDYQYVVKKNNLDVIKSGTLEFASGRAAIEVILNEPAMVYVQVSRPGDDAKARIVVGAA